MTRKEKELLVWWNEALQDFPRKSEGFQMRMALEYYNAANPNDPADLSDLIDALEAQGDE